MAVHFSGSSTSAGSNNAVETEGDEGSSNDKTGEGARGGEGKGELGVEEPDVGYKTSGSSETLTAMFPRWDAQETAVPSRSEALPISEVV